jgi:Ca-activated chloride channel family protein
VLAAAVLLGAGPLFADKTYSANKKANKLYNQGNYEKSLEQYDQALLESPGDSRLKMNKGSALYKLNDFGKAEESYHEAEEVKDPKARADLHYNLGNALYRQGESMEMHGNQQASEKYKAAVQEYIKALDFRPSDKDSKWNLQLTQLKIKNLENQQQNQQNKDQQGKDQQNQQDQDKQNRKQDKNSDKDKQDQDRQGQKQDQPDKNKDTGEKEKPQPQPSQQQDPQMEKKEAERLIEQFADDEDKLNKPPRKAGVAKTVAPEKDW